MVLSGAISARMAAQAPARIPAQAMDEYQVKAGFVSSFPSFIEWPPDAFHGPGDPLTICVLGSNPFGTSLDALVAGKSVAGHNLTVRPIPDAHQVTGCHMLFVSSSEHLRLRGILASLGEQSVFSIGDTSDFIAEGGVVSLLVDNGRVRIEINADAARERRLRINARLLQLAKGVKR